MIWKCPNCSALNGTLGFATSATCGSCRRTCYDLQGLVCKPAERAAPIHEKSLTLWHVIQQQVSRSNRWHPGGITDWSALEWAGAMAGEAGEACNAAKKLKRIDDKCANINNEPGRSLTTRDAARDAIGKEVADTILYAISLCAREEIDLEVHLVERFNTKSEEYGFPERL